jgi:alkylglycerol monooxygenase
MPENFTPPPFITFAIPLFFILMAIEMFYGYRKKLNLYRFDDTIADLSTGVISQIAGIFLRIVTLIPYFYLWSEFKIFEVSMSSVPWWIAALVLWDFCYYWQHRLSHSVNFLWASHIIHHHSSEYNLIVALRQTSTGGLTGWIFYLPMALLGIPPWMYLAVGQINLIYQYWVHTKAVDKLPAPAEFLLSTPSHHRVHHAINREYLDKNHGGIFIIWDRLFGSFKKETSEPVYGTVKPFHSFNPVWANFHYFADMVKMSWKAKGLWQKILVWIKPPVWQPATENSAGGDAFIPEINTHNHVKYSPPSPKSVNRYVLVWFIASLLGTFGYLIFALKFSFNLQIILSALIILSMTTLCGMLEYRRWSYLTEFARVAILPVAAWVLVPAGNVQMILSGLLVLAAVVSFYFLMSLNKYYNLPETEYALSHALITAENGIRLSMPAGAIPALEGITAFSPEDRETSNRLPAKKATKKNGKTTKKGKATSRAVKKSPAKKGRGSK